MKLDISFLFPVIILFGLFACKEDYVEPQFYGSLQGQVLQADDLTPIADAIVKISPLNTTAITDAEGKFVFEEIPVGGYTLEVRRQGFDTELQSVEVLKDKTSQFDILLEVDLIPNMAPNGPTIVAPADQATEQLPNLTLAWQATDADADDELKYTVYLFKQGGPQVPVAEGITDTLLEVTDLAHGTTYHWQVVVNDGEAAPVYGPVWSFTTAAFPLHRIRWVRKVNGVFQIFSSNEGGAALQLSAGSVSCWRPKLSPDRTKIAFLSNNGIATHLYMMDPNGGNVIKLTSVPVASVDAMEMDYCWSPNSARLLYPSNDKLFSISREGTDLQLVATAPVGMQFASVDWAELGDDKVVRLTGNNIYQSEIHLLDAAGTLSLLVADEPGKTGNPVFSINGNSILYTHDVSGFQNLDGRQLDSHVFLHNLATGQTTDLSVDKVPGTNDIDPSFSPTGSEVIFTNTPNDGISARSLFKCALNGIDREVLVDNAEMGDWY